MWPRPLVSSFYCESSVHKTKPTRRPGLAKAIRDERLDWCKRRSIGSWMNVISGAIPTATRANPMTEVLVSIPESSSASRSKGY